jgi:Tfp pilus assembly protein PilN
LNRLQMFLVTLLIVGFCCVAGVGLAKDAQTPTPEQQRATLQAEFKDLSAEYKTQGLIKENAELKMERIAKRAGEVQEALKALEPKEPVKSPTGKDKGK